MFRSRMNLLCRLLFAAGLSATGMLHAADNTQTLAEITVTGEKADKSQFDTATSVSVFTAPEFDRSGNVRSEKDLFRQTVNMVSLGTDNFLPAVRGVDGSGPAYGAVAFLAGTRPRLNLSLDGHSFTYNEMAFGTRSLWDIKQVEVLRGPQSQIQGRNAIAGSIVMRSNDPTDNWEGAVKLGIGNQSSRQSAVMLSGPIVKNNLSFRISAERQQRKSFVDLVSYEPVGDPRRIETTTARAKLLFAPSSLPEFYSRLTLNHSQSRAPQGEMLNNPGSPRFTPERPIYQTRSTAAILDTSWQFAPHQHWDNKLLYAKYDNDRRHLSRERNGVSAEVDGREWQFEPVWRFSGSRIKGLAGLYLFDGKQKEHVYLRGDYLFDDTSRNYAAFGEAVWQAAPQFDLTAGARIERDRHQRKGGFGTFRIDRDQAQTVFLPKVELGWQANEQIRNGIKISRGYNRGGAGVTFGRPFVAYEYAPEYVWAYELFSRYHSADKRLSINGNLFFNDYRDMQLPFYLGANSMVIRNAAKVHTYGAEIDARWQADGNLSFKGSLGLLHTKIKRYPDSGTEGKRLSRAPAYTAAAGVNWQHPQGWEAGADVQLSGGYYSNAQNDEVGKIKAYSQVNLYAAYNFRQGRVSLYADNVFDSGKKIFVPAADRREALVQRPRAIGISGEWKF